MYLYCLYCLYRAYRTRKAHSQQCMMVYDAMLRDLDQIWHLVMLQMCVRCVWIDLYRTLRLLGGAGVE